MAVVNRPKIWIIDSNIVIYWIMGKSILNWLIVDQYGLSQDLVNTYLKRYEDSINFVDNAMKQKKKFHRFYIVDLTLNEVFSGVKDEIKSVILFKEGYPLSRWTDKRISGQIQLREDFIVKIRDFVYESFDKLMNKIDILATPMDHEEYFDIYPSIVLLNVAMGTQDAILLTTSIIENADYFVTKDEASIGKFKKMIKDKYGLEIVNPKQALTILEE